ncbi:hypothetical protein NUW54_g14151 [Trametes sanguinea]|uniref:Uncharacterized protein n=1 Tax=Trametes sanguinea TaxID=158606 RepID=A0ACC1MF82_9APHY|nr:hypothetical protein NUW54_g14151 [Trametes sanguinea]
MESLDILLARMEPLREVIVRALPAGEGYDKCPKTLRDRLEAFASKVQSVAQEAKELKHKHRIVRFLNASDYSVKIDAWVKKLTWHIHSFILEGTIAIELSVHEMATDMRQGFDELGHRVGEVHNEVVGLRSDIQQQGTESAIPGLRYTPRARFDYGQSGRSQCDEGTRDEVLKTIYSWLRPEDRALKRVDELLPFLKLLPDRSILWIYALAGAGKTTLAETVAQWCHERECLGSSFFCARDGDRSDVQCIAQNIASDLAHHCTEFKEALLAV